jgi:hypothetical protein
MSLHIPACIFNKGIMRPAQIFYKRQSKEQNTMSEKFVFNKMTTETFTYNLGMSLKFFKLERETMSQFQC